MNFHGSRQGFTWGTSDYKHQLIILSLKFKGTVHLRDSPCGRCWQRREAQWRLHLRCFSGPGKGGEKGFILGSCSLKRDYNQHSSSQQSNIYLAQGTVGLFIKKFYLICSRAGLFVRKTPRHLSKEVRWHEIKHISLWHFEMTFSKH